MSLSAASASYTLPSANGYSASIALHSSSAPAGTKLSLGTQISGGSTGGSRPLWRNGACPALLTVRFVNANAFPVVIHVDAVTFRLQCRPQAKLYGVSFYQLTPVPKIVDPVKVGDAVVDGSKVTFTPDVSTLTLPPNTVSAITGVAEGSKNRIAIPIVPGAETTLTSNSPGLPSSLAFKFSRTGGGGSLFSAGCFPAFANGNLAPALRGVVLLGTPSYFCELDTVDSPTVLFGGDVTFTITTPMPDRSFIGLDGPGGEFLCTPTGVTNCDTPPFTLPTIKNTIVGNVEDLQLCLQPQKQANCNGNGDPQPPVPSASSIAPQREFQVLVADDATYVGSPGPCKGDAICGGFAVDTSAGSCLIDEGPPVSGDLPPPPPHYVALGGPQQSPPVNGGTATKASFPAVGPYVALHLISGAPGTTCSVVVTETTGPLLRSQTLTIPVT